MATPASQGHLGHSLGRRPAPYQNAQPSVGSGPHADVVDCSELVDGERYLFGDALVDFVSLALHRRIENEPSHPFLLGYAEATGIPIRLDPAARRQLAIFRLLGRLLSEELAELSRPLTR